MLKSYFKDYFNILFFVKIDWNIKSKLMFLIPTMGGIKVRTFKILINYFNLQL